MITKDEKSVVEDENNTINKIYKHFALDLFFEFWPLLNKKNRTREEDVQLVHSTHELICRWKRNGQPIHFQRAEWMISHVYAVIGMGKSALYHAENCLQLTDEYNIQNIDLAYAYEGMARASAAVDNIVDFRKYFNFARYVGGNITKLDKEIFLMDLDKGPWFNMK